jgi:chemotaxis protein MotB
MARRAIKEEHISHERWLVSYADFLTLMLAFFVVMYSISQVNEGKYRILSQTLTAAFNTQPLSLKPIQIGDPVTGQPGNVDEDLDIVSDAGDAVILGGQVGPGSTQPQLPEEFRRISERIENQFADLIDAELVSVVGNEEWLEIELKSSMLFESGAADPRGQARQIIGELSSTLEDSALPVRVEGFTDDVPINSPIYPSNWELSSARAASIVKLMEDDGIEPERLAAVGYGEHQPVASNATPEGRAANRRVVLMISRTANLRPVLPRPERPTAAAAPAVVESGSATVEPEPGLGSEIIEFEKPDGGVIFTTRDRAEELRREFEAEQAGQSGGSSGETP